MNLKNILGKTLHQSYFLVAMCVGVILGVILALVLKINYFASVIWIVFAMSLFVIAYIWPRLVFIVLAFVAGMILAFVRVATELKGESYIKNFYDETIVVKGTIKGDPDFGDGEAKIKLVDLKFGEKGEFATSGSIYIVVKKYSELERGDTLVVRGKLVGGFGTYAGYMHWPAILKVERLEPGNLTLKIRNWFAERIKQLVPEPQVKLGLSYLLGMRNGLPEDLSEKLRVVGLVHIVVASGAHLSILVEIAKKIFGKLSRFAGMMFSILFILFFMAMVGWTPSILRAGIMAIFTTLAWYVGRKIAPWRIIVMVAAMTLMMNPMFVIDLGWLLSFASFGGIMLLGPELTRFFYGKQKPGFVAATIITTMSATLMTLPIILYFYGMVSLISVVANLLILPTLAYAMGLVFLTGVLAGIWGVGTVVAFIATKLLEFHIFVVDFLGQMTQFLVRIEPYQVWVFGLYGVIGVMILILKWKKIRLDRGKLDF